MREEITIFAEQSRAEQSRAEQSRAEQSRAFDIDFFENNWTSLPFNGTACKNAIFLYNKDSVITEK